MSSSKPSGSTTIVNNQDPWSGVQEPIKFGLEQARQNYDSASPQYYPNSTVVPFSNQTNTALGQMENRAMAGSPLMQGAQQQMQSTLNGDYLSAGNPYFDQMAGRIKAQVMPGIDARFNMAGRAGSAMHGRALGEGLGDAIGGLAYQNYGAERGNMMNAMQMAPAMAQADYLDPQMLAQVGQTYEGQAGANLQDQINRFNFEQNLPDEKLRQYMTLVQGGNYGGSSSSQQPIYSNPAASGLGMAASAASIAGSLFGKGGIWGG